MREAATAPQLDARLLAWRRLAEDRLSNAHKRTAFCLVAGVIGAGLYTSWVALAWCALVAAAYLVDVRVWVFAQTAQCTGPRIWLQAWVFAQSMIACALGPILWLEGGASGKIVAAYYVAAGVFNALATFKGNARLLAIALGTPIAVLMTLPIVDFVLAAPAARELSLLVPLLGALVLGFFSLSIWRGLSMGEETRIAEQSAALAERARADQEAEGLGRLLGMVERELRAPLQALTTATGRLLQSDAPEETKRQMRAAHEAGEVLEMAVGDLSALSTLQAGGLRTTLSRTDPRALAETLAEAWRERAQAKWLELFVDVSPTVPEAVALDPKRVAQVLHQLLANAVRFTRQGGVRLRVDVAPGRDEQGLWIAFSVSDTGPGIDPERLAEVLAPGDRVARAAARGYGLGTAISACVAEAMGGRLTARSVPGQGSAFSLVAPTRSLGRGEQPDDSAVAEPKRQKPLSVLVVDDHAGTRRLASVFLGEAAALVTTASSADQALAVWTQQRFDVVLTDLHMPGMDGYALSAALRAQGEAGARVRIVAFSAEDGAWDAGRARAAGIDGFVAKPFTPSSLFQEITRVMALRQAA